MLKIHTSCVGNHDLDFGVDHLEYLMGSTRFPWLLSNILDSYSCSPLAGASLYRLFEWQGHRVGIIGLVEEVRPFRDNHFRFFLTFLLFRSGSKRFLRSIQKTSFMKTMSKQPTSKRFALLLSHSNNIIITNKALF